MTEQEKIKQVKLNLADYDVRNVLGLLKSDILYHKRNGAPILIVRNQKRLFEEIKNAYEDATGELYPWDVRSISES